MKKVITIVKFIGLIVLIGFIGLICYVKFILPNVGKPENIKVEANTERLERASTWQIAY